MNPEEIFQKRYAVLNDAQKEAVDAIYGPVMVIAGPGTGKTEVLAMRIAQLLRSDAQVNPAEILCLTYTDDAAHSMRNRLIEIIGPSAHKVNICTFHAFCNQVIQQNRDYFAHRELELVDEMGRIDIVHEILDELPEGHLLRRLKGDIYYDTGRLLALFSLMKEEHLSVEIISEAIDREIEALPDREDMRYKRKSGDHMPGDLKQHAFDSMVEKLEQTRAAAKLFDSFQEKMMAKGWYDFSDMILWVLAAFKQNPAMLMQYQEQSQYILVDEFQDTNGAQNELLRLLIDYWDDPNVFVVGDDDQSVFEFQGARIQNVVDFYHRYSASMKMIVLKNNYRSSPPILEWAARSIEGNKGRLILQIPELGLDKDIHSAHPRFEKESPCPQPVVRAYPTRIMEEAHLVSQIEELIREGVNPSQIAVLYAQHKQVDRVLDLMDRRGLPYLVKKPSSLLEQPIIQRILDIFRYIQQESEEVFKGEPILFQLIHAPFFKTRPKDIGTLALYMNQNKAKNPNLRNWRTTIADDLLMETVGLENPGAFRRLAANLERWQASKQLMTLSALLESIVYESGLLAYLLSQKDHIFYVEVLQSFYDYLRRCADRQPGIRLDQFLERIDKQIEMNLIVPVHRVFSRRDGVQFFTAHAAKGNEFEYVFLLGCTSNFWEKKVGNRALFRLPETLAYSKAQEGSSQEEVARRLFYVALTRAKKHLQVSYAMLDEENKALSCSGLVHEVCPPSEQIITKMEDPELMEAMKWAMLPPGNLKIELAQRAWIDQAIRQMAMSTSALSKYLRCPLSYYYENVLRVPFVKRDSMAYGSAVHDALEFLFSQMKRRQGTFPELSEVLQRFYRALENEKAAFHGTQFERRRDQGTKEISDYYNQFLPTFPKDVDLEMNIARFPLEGIPVTGKIDRVEYHGGSCVVVDYKTGNPDRRSKKDLAPPGEEGDPGGDYWRQMAFYKLILEENPVRPLKVDFGRFEYLTPKKNGETYHPVVNLGPEDVEQVRAQVKEVYARIMNQDFDRGCNEDNCTWCRFARNYELRLDESSMEENQEELLEDASDLGPQ